MFIVFIRAIILYMIMLFAMRLMGKRQIGELQPSELAVTILISNMATLPIEDNNIPMLMGAVPIFALVAFEILLSILTLKSKKLRHFISGNPVVLIKDGIIDQRQMKNLRFSIDDLMDSLRENNIYDLRDVHYAIVETNGKISVLPRFSSQTITAEMLNIKGADVSPQAVIISDGELIIDALKSFNLNQAWVDDILAKKNTTLKDVFIMTSNNKKSYCLVLRS